MELRQEIRSWDESARRNRLAGAAITILLHAVVVIAVLQYKPVRQAFTQALPIMVSLITPQPIVQKRLEPPVPLPVKPTSQQPTTPVPAQLIAATSEAPAPGFAPTPPEPAPVLSEPPSQPITTAPRWRLSGAGVSFPRIGFVSDPNAN